MGRKRWAERRHPAAVPVVIDEWTAFKARPGVILCGHPFGDGTMCKTPAAVAHLHNQSTEELLNRADRTVPAKGLVEALEVAGMRVVTDPTLPTDVLSFRRPTYDVLRAASAERAQFTVDQAQTMLSAALGTRPHLAARVIDRLGPVLAGELARAVDAAVDGRINGYLADERAELNRLYQDQAGKLAAERENRGRDLHAERWTTPSRLA